MIGQQQVIEILGQVPEKRLYIFEVASKLVREDGSVDPDKVAFYAKELKQASEEARAYITETGEAVQCLKDLLKR